jgi:hypothetical protein
MTHVDLEIPDEVARKLRERAEQLGMTVPRYVAEIVRVVEVCYGADNPESRS